MAQENVAPARLSPIGEILHRENEASSSDAPPSRPRALSPTRELDRPGAATSSQAAPAAAAPRERAATERPPAPPPSKREIVATLERTRSGSVRERVAALEERNVSPRQSPLNSPRHARQPPSPLSAQTRSAT